MIYDFDTPATSPVLPEVMEAYLPRLSEAANNPSSAHGGGIKAAGFYEEARQSIARSLDCRPEEIIFTSGGTESINLALKGWACAEKRRPARVITSAGEHEAVLASLDYLQSAGLCETSRIPLLYSGQLDQDALESSLKTNPAGLISLIAVSNETGAVNDLAGLVPVIRRTAPQTLIHSDIVQACGKLPFSFRNWGLDLASIAGHKIGAPKGTGLLIKKQAIRLVPQLHGGGQQEGLRPGTVDVAGAMALAQALVFHVNRLDDHLEDTARLRRCFLDSIGKLTVPHRILSPEGGSPYVLSIAFPGLRGETLMNALSAESIYISTGSACGSRLAGENRVLAAMGHDKETILSAVRISFNPNQTEQAVLHLAERIAALHARYALGKGRGRS